MSKQNSLTQKYTSRVITGLVLGVILFPAVLLGSLGIVVTMYLLLNQQLPGNTSHLEYIILIIASVVAVVVTFYLRKVINDVANIRKEMNDQ